MRRNEDGDQPHYGFIDPRQIRLEPHANPAYDTLPSDSNDPVRHRRRGRLDQVIPLPPSTSREEPPAIPPKPSRSPQVTRHAQR